MSKGSTNNSNFLKSSVNMNNQDTIIELLKGNDLTMLQEGDESFEENDETNYEIIQENYSLMFGQLIKNLRNKMEQLDIIKDQDIVFLVGQEGTEFNQFSQSLMLEE